MRRLINVKVPIKYEKEIAQVGKEVCLHICAYCLSFNQGHRSGSCLIYHINHLTGFGFMMCLNLQGRKKDMTKIRPSRIERTRKLGGKVGIPFRNNHKG